MELEDRTLHMPIQEAQTILPEDGVGETGAVVAGAMEAVEVVEIVEMIQYLFQQQVNLYLVEDALRVVIRRTLQMLVRIVACRLCCMIVVSIPSKFYSVQSN